MTDPLDLCALCGETTEKSPWIVFNRWIIGTGTCRAMVEAINDEGDYLWEMHPEGSPDDEHASGRVLHWPACATQWIELKMLEADVEMRRKSP